MSQENEILSFDLQQRTLKKEVTIAGKGLFTGKDVEISLSPASENTGIVFQRVDLLKKPFIPAGLKYVKEMPRSTFLGEGEVQVQTVEHLLSALHALEIDNLIVKISGPEVLIDDGSSRIFVEAIEKAGIEKLEIKKRIYGLKAPLYWSEGDVHLIALPSKEMRISYTMHYPHSSFLRSQYYSFKFDSENYKREIAPSRTFSLFEEVQLFIEKGLIKGGGLENGVIIKDNKVLNPEGLRFSDEMVRHKILDLIGDLSLIGVFFVGHIIAIRSGHFSNIAFAKKLMKSIILESC